MNRLLRPRERIVFTGFTKPEVEKMEKILEDPTMNLNQEFYKRLARSFNCSKGRAGKPIIKWMEVQEWFETEQKSRTSKNKSRPSANKAIAELDGPINEANEAAHKSKGEKVLDLSELEFEARSSKDGAWYDVDIFLDHRFTSSGEAEVNVRYIGFGEDEDEWVNAKAVRLRSVPLEQSECLNVNVGDVVLCFQERRDQARYYDARIVEVQRRLHDIRGCRCLFLIQYEHDKTEERVRLRRLCRQPTF